MIHYNIQIETSQGKKGTPMTNNSNGYKEDFDPRLFTMIQVPILLGLLTIFYYLIGASSINIYQFVIISFFCLTASMLIGHYIYKAIIKIMNKSDE
jgi:hypothetical protein